MTRRKNTQTSSNSEKLDDDYINEEAFKALQEQYEEVEEDK